MMRAGCRRVDRPFGLERFAQSLTRDVRHHRRNERRAVALRAPCRSQLASLGKANDLHRTPPDRLAPPTSRARRRAPAAPVTPMTPDVVASYDPVLPEADYVKRVAMVPMRDGTKLYTVIVMKKGTSGGPILLSRTPYDAKSSMSRTASQRAVDILADHVQGVRRGRLHHRPAGHPRNAQFGRAVRDEPPDRRAAQQ